MLLHTTFAALLAVAAADCVFDNIVNQGTGQIPLSDPSLCVGQGEGSWTFSIYNSAVDVPTFDGGNPTAGYAGGSAFIIYDNTCTAQAIYNPPSCGTPWTAEENFLPLELIVQDINLDLGGEYFKFAYGAGLGVDDNNHCGCSGMSSGLQGARGCKCAFPLDGDWS